MMFTDVKFYWLPPVKESTVIILFTLKAGLVRMVRKLSLSASVDLDRFLTQCHMWVNLVGP